MLLPFRPAFTCTRATGRYWSWRKFCGLGHTSITGIGLADVQAFVVSLAILDATSRKGIPSGTNLSTASSLFVDPSNADLATAPPKLMATTWSNLINGGSFAHNAGIPAPVADQVRIYQRLFPLNIP